MQEGVGYGGYDYGYVRGGVAELCKRGLDMVATDVHVSFSSCWTRTPQNG